MDWKYCLIVMGAIIPEPEGLSTNSRPDCSVFIKTLRCIPSPSGPSHGQSRQRTEP